MPSSPKAWLGGPKGWGSPYLGPSLCLPWAGTKAGVIVVPQFMEGVASILLRIVFACWSRVWSVGRRCVLARVRLPEAVSVGAGGRGRGGAWRTGLAAFSPRAPRPFRGERGLPPGLGGGRGPAPMWPDSGIPRAGGGGGGERGEGHAVVPRHPPPGGPACGPRPLPPFMAAGVAPRIPPCQLLGRDCLETPGRRARSGRPLLGQSGREGGGAVRRPFSRGSAGGLRGAGGGGGSLCCGLSLCPPLAGTKAGRFVIALGASVG